MSHLPRSGRPPPSTITWWPRPDGHPPGRAGVAAPAGWPMRLSSALRLQEFWIGTTLAALTLLLVIVNMVLSSANRRLQADVAGRQQYIQQSVPLETLYRAIVNDLGALATRNRDDQL